MDILITGSQAGGLPNIYSIVYENLGNNTFLPVDTLGGDYISACIIDDFNGDTRPDIIIQGFVDDTSVYWNTSVTTRLTDAVYDITFHVYPNPSNGIVTLQSTEYTVGNIRVFDARGALVASDNMAGFYKSLQLSLPNGVYFMQIVNGKKSQVQKIIIQ
ncbi:MAG: T9SS type A sorting domain-containing protein [Saprospiraceae bacterium]